MREKYDVAIIGGGPAGSTAASFLAMAGLMVVVFEKEKFPRPHVGESLLPFCYDIFEALGVLDEMKKRFLRKPGAVFCDADGSSETTYCFKTVVENPKHLSFHVRRDEFDHMLLDNAVKKGTDVYEGSRVLDLNLDDPTKGLLSVQTADGEKSQVQVGFVLDASGRSGLIAKKKKLRKASKDLDRTAFHSYWQFKSIPDEIRRGMIRIIHLGGERKGWIWCIPVDETKISIGVVVDNKAIKLFKKSNTLDNWVNDFYESEMANSGYLVKMLKSATRDEKVIVNGDYSYTSIEKWASNYAMIGDSGQFIDPIFSSGVFIAMKSAQMVSNILPTYLETKDEDILGKVYETIANGYETVESLINLYYAPEQLNFSRMGAIDENTSNNYADFKQSYALLHYLLAGDFFERGHVYKAFFKDLRNEKKFERWKNLVNWSSEESGVYDTPQESCGETLHASS